MNINKIIEYKNLYLKLIKYKDIEVTKFKTDNYKEFFTDKEVINWTSSVYKTWHDTYYQV